MDGFKEKIEEKVGLLTSSHSYKPFRYPWAYDFWKRQQQVHWMPEEVPLGEDCKDWAVKLNDNERNLLTQIFRFFTQADVDSGYRLSYQHHGDIKPDVSSVSIVEDSIGFSVSDGYHTLPNTGVNIKITNTAEPPPPSPPPPRPA